MWGRRQDKRLKAEGWLWARSNQISGNMSIPPMGRGLGTHGYTLFQVHKAWQPGLKHMKGSISLIKNKSFSKETQLSSMERNCFTPELQGESGGRKHLSSPMAKDRLCQISCCCRKFALFFPNPPFFSIRGLWILDNRLCSDILKC